MTNSSPVVSNTTFEMVSLSAGSSTGLATGSGSTGYPTGGYGNAIGDYYYSGYYPQTYGYTCPRCGAWVYSGNYHNCSPVVIPTVISYPVYIPVSNPIDTKALEEKLDELTEEIKKLRKQTKKKLAEE